MGHCIGPHRYRLRTTNLSFLGIFALNVVISRVYINKDDNSLGYIVTQKITKIWAHANNESVTCVYGK